VVATVSTLDRFRRLFATGDREEPFVCCSCGERYEVEFHTCPECEGFSVERD